MRSKKMWIATICENGHWQVLCIVNPGKEHCVAFLLDSLVSSVNQRPANFDKCQAYVTAFVNQVYQDDNLSNQQALPLRIGLIHIIWVWQRPWTPTCTPSCYWKNVPYPLFSTCFTFVWQHIHALSLFHEIGVV